MDTTNTDLYVKNCEALQDASLMLESIVDKSQKLCSSNMKYIKSLGLDMSIPKTIIVIGCGGTGSWLLPKIVKILNDGYHKNMISHSMDIVLIDGDDVEEKNLLRQNFIPHDINRNKAEVMAERYGPLLNSKCTVRFIDRYITTRDYLKYTNKDHADKYFVFEDLEGQLRNRETLIFNLIDNGVSRKIIHLFSHHCGMSVVDIGNNEFNGQLDLSVYDYSKSNISTVNSLFYMRHPDQFDDMSNLSIYNCADVDVEAVGQMFNANDMAAAVGGNFLNTLVMNKSIRYSNISFVTNQNMSVESSSPLFKTKFFSDIEGPSVYRNMYEFVESVYIPHLKVSIGKHFNADEASISKRVELNMQYWNQTFDNGRSANINPCAEIGLVESPLRVHENSIIDTDLTDTRSRIETAIRLNTGT